MSQLVSCQSSLYETELYSLALQGRVVAKGGESSMYMVQKKVEYAFMLLYGFSIVRDGVNKNYHNLTMELVLF
jgi:hypothetical protein